MLRLTPDHIELPSSFALVASIEREAGLVIADRGEVMLTEWLVNFDSKVLLDFDATGRLGAIEIAVPINRWPHSPVTIPAAKESVILRLCDPPAGSGTLSPEDEVHLHRDRSTDDLQASFRTDGKFDRCYAVGRNVFVAMQEGSLAAIYMKFR
jgi:hypothetical protein